MQSETSAKFTHESQTQRLSHPVHHGPHSWKQACRFQAQRNPTQNQQRATIHHRVTGILTTSGIGLLHHGHGIQPLTTQKERNTKQ